MKKTINRSTLIIVPKQAYYDWSNGLFEDHEIDKLDECLCYLLDDDWDITKVVEYLKEHYDEFFVEMLDGMCTYEEAWPEKRSWIMFNQWFDWHYSSIVWDLLPDKRIRRKTW